jgi:hypothetical protein
MIEVGAARLDNPKQTELVLLFTASRNHESDHVEERTSTRSSGSMNCQRGSITRTADLHLHTTPNLLRMTGQHCFLIQLGVLGLLFESRTTKSPSDGGNSPLTGEHHLAVFVGKQNQDLEVRRGWEAGKRLRS